MVFLPLVLLLEILWAPLKFVNVWSVACRWTSAAFAKTWCGLWLGRDVCWQSLLCRWSHFDCTLLLMHSEGCFKSVRILLLRKTWQLMRGKQLICFRSHKSVVVDEGSATKEISYTSWRNQLKSSWNHEESKQISLKSSSEISPTLQPHPLLQLWRNFWGKWRGNQREIRKSRTPKWLVADPSVVDERFEYCGQKLTHRYCCSPRSHFVTWSLWLKGIENKTKDFIRRANCLLASSSVVKSFNKILQRIWNLSYSAAIEGWHTGHVQHQCRAYIT